jgi:hypothetical protein
MAKSDSNKFISGAIITMSQNYCHHLNAAGAFCRGIPIKKRDYCFWHLNETGRRMKAARERAQSERVTLQLPVLDDLHAVQVSLMQLGEAIVHDEIDERKGRLLLAVLRLAASNLKAQGIWLDEVQRQDGDDVLYMSENADFEQQYGLPEEFDLSVDPEVAFPVPQSLSRASRGVRDLPLGANLGGNDILPLNPNDPGGPHIPAVGMCGNHNLPLNPNDGFNEAPVPGNNDLRAGAPYIPSVGMYGNDDLRVRLGHILRAAATPIPGVRIEATADDMELMEVYERQGEQAGLQRATVLERNRKRRERCEQRVRYEEMARNRNIQLAAEKLFVDQQRKAGAVSQGSAEAPTNRKPPQSEGESCPDRAIQAGTGAA